MVNKYNIFIYLKSLKLTKRLFGGLYKNVNTGGESS